MLSLAESRDNMAKKKVRVSINGHQLRRGVMLLLGWLHCGLLFSALYPVVMSIPFGKEDAQVGFWFCQSLLLCIPVALSYFAEHDIPALWQYLLASLAICLLMWPLFGSPLGALAGILPCFFRGRSRLSEEPADSLMDAPHIPAALAFLIPFLYGATGDSAFIQKAGLFCAAVYLLLCLLYHGIGRIDDYLVLNRDMKNLPTKRISRMATAALLAVAAAFGALVLPAVLGAGFVRIDLSALERGGGSAPVQVVQGQDAQPSENSLMERLNRENPGWQIPPVILQVLNILVGAAVLILIGYGVYRIIRNFRGSFTVQNDMVEFLNPTDSAEPVKRVRRKRPGVLDFSPNAVVRRRYRKTILRAGKEPPEKWASPRELEQAAGLPDTQENALLHGLYEKARYSRSGCTKEETSLLR